MATAYGRKHLHTNWAPQNDFFAGQRLHVKSYPRWGRRVYVERQVVWPASLVWRTPLQPPILGRLPVQADGLQPPRLGFSKARSQALREDA